MLSRYTTIKRGRRRLLVPNAAFLTREFTVMDEEGPVLDSGRQSPQPETRLRSEVCRTCHPVDTTGPHHCRILLRVHGTLFSTTQYARLQAIVCKFALASSHGALHRFHVNAGLVDVYRN